MVFSNEQILAVGTQGWILTLISDSPSINPDYSQTLHFHGKLTDAMNNPLAGQVVDLNLRWFKNGSPVLSFRNGLWTQYPGNDPANFAFGPAVTAADGTYTISLGLGDFGHSGYGWISTLQEYPGVFDAVHFITSSGEVQPPPPTVSAVSIAVTDPANALLATGFILGVLGFLWINESRKDKRKRKMQEMYRYW